MGTVLLVEIFVELEIGTLLCNGVFVGMVVEIELNAGEFDCTFVGDDEGLNPFLKSKSLEILNAIYLSDF